MTRVGYSTQKPGISALYPADGQLNLSTDKYSDELRRRVATEASKVSFSETRATIAATTGGAVGKRQLARSFAEETSAGSLVNVKK